ncbi:unnamed protein product, partial [Heterosigma akashiwo]
RHQPGRAHPEVPGPPDRGGRARAGPELHRGPAQGPEAPAVRHHQRAGGHRADQEVQEQGGLEGLGREPARGGPGGAGGRARR